MLTLCLFYATYLQACVAVTVPDAFNALFMSRNDPMLVCEDRYDLKKNTLFIDCKRP